MPHTILNIPYHLFRPYSSISKWVQLFNLVTFEGTICNRVHFPSGWNQPSRPNRLTISLEMTLFLLLSPGLILLRTFSLLDRLLTMFTLKVKQCCFKQHSKGEWKNNKFDLEISLLPKSKLELKKLEHFFFKMCHNLVFMERETFDTFSTLIFSTYSPGSKLNSRNLPLQLRTDLRGVPG